MGICASASDVDAPAVSGHKRSNSLFLERPDLAIQASSDWYGNSDGSQLQTAKLRTQPVERSSNDTAPEFPVPQPQPLVASSTTDTNMVSRTSTDSFMTDLSRRTGAHGASQSSSLDFDQAMHLGSGPLSPKARPTRIVEPLLERGAASDSDSDAEDGPRQHQRHTQQNSAQPDQRTESKEDTSPRLRVSTSTLGRNARAQFIRETDRKLRRVQLQHMHWRDVQLGDEVGSGFFGAVHAATHKRIPGLEFAVKISKHTEATKSEQHLLRYTGNHPYICSLHKSFHSSSHCYLVTDLCHGGDLFHVVKERGPFSEESVRIIARQIAEAIAHIHSKNIVHLDIKLENILLRNHPDDTDAPLEVLLCDFGLARMCPPDFSGVHAVGTPQFAPPEAVESGIYSHKFDIWGLGLATFLLLGGYHPFDEYGDSPQEDILQRICDAEWEFSGQEWAHISDVAKDFVALLMSHDPDDRPVMSEVLQHPFLRIDEPLPAPSPKQEVAVTASSFVTPVATSSSEDTAYQTSGSSQNLLGSEERSMGSALDLQAKQEHEEDELSVNVDNGDTRRSSDPAVARSHHNSISTQDSVHTANATDTDALSVSNVDVSLAEVDAGEDEDANAELKQTPPRSRKTLQRLNQYPEDDDTDADADGTRTRARNEASEDYKSDVDVDGYDSNDEEFTPRGRQRPRGLKSPQRAGRRVNESAAAGESTHDAPDSTDREFSMSTLERDEPHTARFSTEPNSARVSSAVESDTDDRHASWPLQKAQSQSRIVTGMRDSPEVSVSGDVQPRPLVDLRLLKPSASLRKAHSKAAE